MSTAGCSDKVTFHREPLTAQEAQETLQSFRIDVPDSYAFVSMFRFPPPGPGSAGYVGVYDAQAPIAPVTVDGTVLTPHPDTCANVHVTEFPDGTTCPELSNLRRYGSQLEYMDILTVTDGTLPSGKSRVYLNIFGN